MMSGSMPDGFYQRLQMSEEEPTPLLSSPGPPGQQRHHVRHRKKDGIPGRTWV